MDITLKNKMRWLLLILVPFLLANCQVMLIGAYDEHVDQTLQQISKELSLVFVKVEKNIDDNRPDDNKYEKFRDSYIEILSNVENLKIRTNSLPKYTRVTQQISLLTQNIKDLESLHKIGLTNKNVLESAKTLIETSLGSMLSAQNALKREKAN